MSPKVIASCGQACAHALVNESRGILRFSPDAPARTCAAIFASSIRCTQYVHFSITPRIRTVTFGFFCILVMSGAPFAVNPEFSGNFLFADRPLIVIEEIEPADFERAIVRTITRANATVISHYVK